MCVCVCTCTNESKTLYILLQVTIKAMAVSIDGLRESSVVTKTFLIEEASEVEEDSEGNEKVELCENTCRHVTYMHIAH